MNQSPSSLAAPWICAGGDPTRRGLLSRSVRLDPKPMRQLPSSGSLQASVVFDTDDRAFVADMAGRVQAFSADGTVLWQVRLDGPISATPAVDPIAGRLYVGTHAGWLAALRTIDGRILWRRRLPTESDARILSDLLPLPGIDTLVTSSWGGRFLAIEGASGDTRQTWDAGISPQSGAMADTHNQVYCLRAMDGRGIEWVSVSPGGTETVLHQEPESSRPARRLLVVAAPVLDPASQRIHAIVNQNGAARLLAWSIAEDRLLWNHELPAAVLATPTVRADGTVLVCDLAGKLHAVDPHGQRRFSYHTGCEYLLTGSVSDTSDTTFLGDPWGRLHVVGPDGKGQHVFESRRSFQARLSFDRHGNLYLPGSDHMVHVFRNLNSPDPARAG